MNDGITELLAGNPDLIASPFPTYAAMRAAGPFFSPEMNAWVVTRYDHVREVLAASQTFSSRAPMGPSPGIAAAAIESALADREPAQAERVARFLRERGNRLFMVDGRAHRRDRQRLNKVFTSSRIAALREPIRGICDELIDALPKGRTIDLVNDYAVLVAARSLGKVLGVDDAYRDDFVSWAGAINAALAPIPEDDRLRVATVIDEYLNHFTRQIDERRADPGDDLLSAIVTAHDDETGTPLSNDEILGLLAQFVAAGVATTSSGIASTLHMLGTVPDLLKIVRDDSAVLASVVNEVLRLESPVQGLFRITTRDTTLAGTDIAEGDTVLVMYGAANRDENAFPDPDTFDFTRENLSAHLAFGYGPHYCIGAPLGTAEIETAVAAILDRTTFELLPDPVEYAPMIILRNPLHLNAVLTT